MKAICSKHFSQARGFLYSCYSNPFIYDELDLLPGERQLPMIQLMRDEALRAFQEWADKIDKAEY